jgi:hypothetical protein
MMGQWVQTEETYAEQFARNKWAQIAVKMPQKYRLFDELKCLRMKKMHALAWFLWSIDENDDMSEQKLINEAVKWCKKFQ